MTILAMDTSCNACTAAIVADDKMVAQTVVNNKRTHSEKLMPMIETMFAAAEISLSEIDVIAVANGPGSFTGVRIGVATAQGLAHSLGIPCISVSTLEALAGNVFGTSGIICPILNARREQVYTSIFSNCRPPRESAELAVGKFPECPFGQHGSGFRRITQDSAMPLAELLERLRDEESVMFLGDGIFEFREEIEAKLGERAKFAPPHLNMNLAGSVAARAMEFIRNGGEISVDNVVIPNYLRLSQAERELKAIEN